MATPKLPPEVLAANAAEREEARQKLRAERVALLKAALTASWGGVDEAATACGLSYDTARALIADDEELHEHLICIRSQLADQIRHRVEMAAAGKVPLPNNEITMTIFGAKTLAGLQERQQVEHSGQIGYGKPPDLAQIAPQILQFPLGKTGTDDGAGGSGEDAPQTTRNGPD